MDAKSLVSSGASYDDGVFDKAEAQAQYDEEQAQSKEQQRSRLRVAVLACLVLLFIISLITIVTSGLVFSHRVASDDCLSQSWVMFAAIMGFLYICLHLQAARKGDPVNRSQPASQHPLHSFAVVVARIDLITWAIGLLIVSISVSKNPSRISCLNLAACAFVTPALTFLVCVVEKATRPFDLPNLTARSARPASLVTCRVSALMANMMMHEVTSDESISRRASAASRHHHRPNSNTQHAAAIAASTVGKYTTGGLSGPRPPPVSVKEARPWSFTKFDDRTKQHLADSVNEASHSSETRIRVGGPRPLATSDIAVKMGVLPPPVCTEPRKPQVPDKDPGQDLARAGGGGGGRNSSGGGWRGDWSSLRNATGWHSPADSGATTPASTPALEYGPGPSQPRNRLSTVAEDRVSHGRRREITYRTVGGTTPAPASPRGREVSTAVVAPAPARRSRTYSETPAIPSPSYTTAPPHRTRTMTEPRERHYQSQPRQQEQAGFPFGNADVPRLPPAAAGASPTRAPTTARVRLQRAQDALKTPGTPGRTLTGTVVLNRPQRLTGDSSRRRTEDEYRRPEDDRRRPEDDRRRLEDGRRRPEDDRRRLEDGRRRPEDDRRRPEDDRRRPEDDRRRIEDGRRRPNEDRTIVVRTHFRGGSGEPRIPGSYPD